MKRFLIALAIFAAAIWVLRRLAGLWDAWSRAEGAPGARRSAAGRRGESVTELVRDRVCNTYVPREKALTLEEAGRTHYFCSEPCRSRHIARASRVVSVA